METVFWADKLIQNCYKHIFFLKTGNLILVNWEQFGSTTFFYLFLFIYLMLMFGTYKWNINNLANTMIVKITTTFSIANLSEPDTLI